MLPSDIVLSKFSGWRKCSSKVQVPPNCISVINKLNELFSTTDSMRWTECDSSLHTQSGRQSEVREPACVKLCRYSDTGPPVTAEAQHDTQNHQGSLSFTRKGWCWNHPEEVTGNKSIQVRWWERRRKTTEKDRAGGGDRCFRVRQFVFSKGGVSKCPAACSGPPRWRSGSMAFHIKTDCWYFSSCRL